MSYKLMIIIAIEILYSLFIWEVHNWYDDHKQVKTVNALLVNRIDAEKTANTIVKNSLNIRSKDDKQAKQAEVEQEHEIITHKTVYDCIIPVDGVRIRNKAASGNSR